MINTLTEKIKGKGTRIVFTEDSDPHILKAAIRLYKEDIVVPVLLGSRVEIADSAAANGWDIEGIETLDPIEYKNMNTMAIKVIEPCKGKLNKAQAKETYLHRDFFGAMYVKLGCVDGLLGGATYSAADTVRPALQLIETRSRNSIVSSRFILMRDDEEDLVMGDCSININSSADGLVEITPQTVHIIRQFGIEPKVGLLSYSTLGSAKGASVAKVNKATTRLRCMPLDFAVRGKVQFGCAVVPEVAKLKAPDSKVTGSINAFIFPNIDAGNIGYKIASRLDGHKAIGPTLQDLSALINDLPRGCNAEEVFKITIITAAQKYVDI